MALFSRRKKSDSDDASAARPDSTIEPGEQPVDPAGPSDAAPTAPAPDAADAAETLGHTSVLLDFIHAIDTGTEPETVGRDNIKSLSMVFGAIESARTGLPVELSA